VFLNGHSAAIEENRMKYLATALFAAGLGIGLVFSGMPAQAQQAAQPQVQVKPSSPAAIAAAKEILALKHVSNMYQNAIPSIVQRTKDALLQNNLNYQKDLNEVAVTVAQTLAGRENEIGEQMAKIYASSFTEQELKDLVTFYKSPLGQKLLAEEPKDISESLAFMNQWAQAFGEEVNGHFRAEMRKRGKDI
jgi:hypothetical protein